MKKGNIKCKIAKKMTMKRKKVDICASPFTLEQFFGATYSQMVRAKKGMIK